MTDDTATLQDRLNRGERIEDGHYRIYGELRVPNKARMFGVTIEQMCPHASLQMPRRSEFIIMEHCTVKAFTC